MKIKNIKLEWYAFVYDSNEHTLKHTNILFGMEEEIAKKIRRGKTDRYKPVTNYETFKNWIQSILMFRYWSKSEYETVIGGLFHHTEEELEKHDIWWQLEPNLDNICNMIIQKMEINFNYKRKGS